MVNILFTSAGRRVELLKSFLKAFGKLEIEGNIVAIDIDPLASALHVADRSYIVPRLTSKEYIPTLLDICRKENIYAIFPLIDPDVPVLAHHRAVIQAVGARLGVIPEKSVETVDDKWLTTQFFQRLGLDTPRSWLSDNLDPVTADYPLFIKPRHGSAAQNTFKVRNARELCFFLTYVPDPIIQEFVAGPEITNDLVADLDGHLLAVISRQRIEVRSGEVSKGITIHNERIIQACVQIARELPAIGPITVQCLMRDNIPYFTEINARMGGGLPLAIAAGVDIPAYLLAHMVNLPFDIPPLGSYQEGLYMTRYDEAFFLTKDDYERIASYHI